MDNENHCSSKDHLNAKANSFCEKCEIYMCNKCEKIHSNLCPKHFIYHIDKKSNEIFTGLCEEKGHQIESKYFCKDHNKLCCAYCIATIIDNDYGQHKKCSVCKIENIKDEKKNILNENCKDLEDLMKFLEKNIKELKNNFKNINNKKEEMKSQIQNIFTKVRNALNSREDKLLLEVDELFNKFYANEDIIKESEKLPNKIKLCLEKGKKIDKNWNNIELKLLLHDCINLENNIEDIEEVVERIKKCNENHNHKKIRFRPDETTINDFLEKIKIFGNFDFNILKFKKCPMMINNDKKYLLSGENQNICTKIGNDYWMGTICDKELNNSGECSWKIKILKSNNNYIMVGVAPIDFDLYNSNYSTCGWYLYCNNSSLYSGPPHNYNDQNTNLNRVKDEIIVVMNMNKRSLKFIIGNEDKGDSYTDIPLDKPIVPAIFLYNRDDSVEIIGY